MDTDIALGAERGDVDDGYALAAVFAAVRRWPQRFELLGISTVAGNTSAATAADCARRLATEFALAPPVTARIPENLSQGADAHLLALGPLGNVAALLAHADSRALELSVVGGVGKRLRHPLLGLLDLNARRDPRAWRAALSAKVRRRRRYPLDVVRALDFGAPVEALAQRGGAAAYLALHSRRWLKQTAWRHPSRRFPAWDLVPALDVLGLLPSAHYDGEALASFDPAAARAAFIDLLESR